MNLKTIRKSKSLTQKNLADRLGISDKAICLYESGKRVPNAVMLKKISQALDCSVDDLLKENQIGDEKCD